MNADKIATFEVYELKEQIKNELDSKVRLKGKKVKSIDVTEDKKIKVTYNNNKEESRNLSDFIVSKTEMPFMRYMGYDITHRFEDDGNDINNVDYALTKVGYTIFRGDDMHSFGVDVEKMHARYNTRENNRKYNLQDGSNDLSKAYFDKGNVVSSQSFTITDNDTDGNPYLYVKNLPKDMTVTNQDGKDGEWIKAKKSSDGTVNGYTDEPVRRVYTFGGKFSLNSPTYENKNAAGLHKIIYRVYNKDKSSWVEGFTYVTVYPQKMKYRPVENKVYEVSGKNEISSDKIGKDIKLYRKFSFPWHYDAAPEGGDNGPGEVNLPEGAKVEFDTSKLPEKLEAGKVYDVPATIIYADDKYDANGNEVEAGGQSRDSNVTIRVKAVVSKPEVTYTSNGAIKSTDKVIKGKGKPGAVITLSVDNDGRGRIYNKENKTGEENNGSLEPKIYTTSVDNNGNWEISNFEAINQNQGNGYTENNGRAINDPTPRSKVTVKQTVNDIDSESVDVSVTLGDSAIKSCIKGSSDKEMFTDENDFKGSLIRGQKEVIIKVPHDAGIVYMQQVNGNAEYIILREDALGRNSDWKTYKKQNGVESENDFCEVEKIESDGFQDTVKLKMKRNSLLSEDKNFRIISNLRLMDYGAKQGWVNINVTNNAPTIKQKEDAKLEYTEKDSKLSTDALLALVEVSDKEDLIDGKPSNLTSGDLKREVVSIGGDTSKKELEMKEGEYEVLYRATDSQGLTAECTLKIKVVKSWADRITPILPEKTKVKDPDNLTTDELNKVIGKVEEKNKDNFPKGTTIGKNGDNLVITYPDGSSDTIPIKDLVEKENMSETYEPNIPEKTFVENKNSLTQEEKDEVIKKIEEANKNSQGNSILPKNTKITVDNNGNATITYPDNQTDTIPAEKLIKEKEKTAKPTVSPVVTSSKKVVGKTEPNAIVKVTFQGKDKPVEVTADEKVDFTVDVPDDVTLKKDEQIKVVARGKDKKDSDEETVTVGDNDAHKIEPNIPQKTQVEDDKHLTKEEKEEVKKKIEDANKDKFPKDTKVEIGDDGKATITYPDGSKDEIKGSELVYKKKESQKHEPKVPQKTLVDDIDNLTDKEQEEVRKKIEDVNKENGKSLLPENTKITVDKKGKATITYPDGSEDVIPSTKLVEQKKNNTLELKNPEITIVEDLKNISDKEKREVLEKIKKANEGDKKITEALNGVSTEIKDNKFILKFIDGSTKEYPLEKVVKERDLPTATLKERKDNGDAIFTLKDKDGKVYPKGSKVKINVNGKEIEVDVEDDKGSFTIPNDKLPDKEKIEKFKAIKNNDISKENEINLPARKKTTEIVDPIVPDKTLVDDINKLTPIEKAQVKKKIEDANKDKFPKDTKVEVGDDGKATITYPDGSTDEIKGSDLVKQKDETVTPTFEKVYENAKKITGKTEPNATVKIKFPGKNEPVEVTANNEGIFTVQVPKDVKLKKDDEVKATAKGYLKKESKEGSVKVSSMADENNPEGVDINIEVFENPKAEDGINNKDKLPKETKFEFKTPVDTTKEGEKDAIVVVTYPDGTKDEVPIKVKITDKNKSKQPKVNPVGKEDDKITGKGEPGSTITVVDKDGKPKKDDQGKDITTTVDKDGNWELPKDKVGKEDKITQTEKDKDPSEPTNISNKEKSKQPKVNPVGKEDDKITGKGEPGSTITVVDKDGKPKKDDQRKDITTTVDKDGNWELPKDKVGKEDKITQTEKDKDPSDPVEISGESPSPAPSPNTESSRPLINPIYEKDDVVKGKGVPGADIVVKDKDGKEIGKTKVDKNGEWSVNVPEDKPLNKDDKITVEQTEPNKKSTTTTTTVKEKPPVPVPTKEKSPRPIINEILDTDEYVTGLGTPGAEVIVTFPDGRTERAIVDRDGRWEVEVPGYLEEGDEIKARQIEPGKDISDDDIAIVRYDDYYDRRQYDHRDEEPKEEPKAEPKKPAKPIRVWTPEKLNANEHKSYIKGYPDGTFGPAKTITRAEVAMIFGRLSLVKDANNALNFKDIKQNDWFKKAVDIVSKQGIVKGYEDGEFKPNRPITRREFAAIIGRYAKNMDAWKTFKDVKPTDWAYQAINKAAGMGWINGYEDGTFRPDNLITRAEVVAIVNRMLNRSADSVFVDTMLYKNAIKNFTDVLRNAWYFYDIYEASVGHEFTRKEDGKSENWTKVTGKEFSLNY